MATESVLEQQRKLHEERERLEDALVKERMLKKPTVSRSWVCILINAHHTGEGPDQL
jgi:hypothetical protein